MKNVRYLAIAVLILMIAAATPGFAQVSSTKVSVPFEFQVGNSILPAGEYSLTQFAGQALVIENASGKGSAVAITNTTGGNGEARQPHLTFNRYGEKYFLAEAWLRYSNAGRVLHVSPAEMEIARVTPTSELVTVGMK
ncbi:MAG TPA: hypothetical protein VF135_00785 [Terriglobales bacterium]